MAPPAGRGGGRRSRPETRPMAAWGGWPAGVGPPSRRPPPWVAPTAAGSAAAATSGSARWRPRIYGTAVATAPSGVGGRAAAPVRRSFPAAAAVAAAVAAAAAVVGSVATRCSGTSGGDAGSGVVAAMSGAAPRLTRRLGQGRGLAATRRRAIDLSGGVGGGAGTLSAARRPAAGVRVARPRRHARGWGSHRRLQEGRSLESSRAKCVRPCVQVTE